MSRLDDLISLIRTVNEVYFITSPERVKAAYLLVDDILELACKTFLQEKTLERREQCRAALEAANFINPTSNGHHKAFTCFCEDDDDIDMTELCRKLGQINQTNVENCINQFPRLDHWSANNPESFIEFGDIINEVKQEFTANSSVQTLLDEAFNRHKTRNKFYHDHHQAGLTINDERCLKALCEMFDLMEHLFPEFLDKVRLNHTVRCQIGVLRLKKTASVGQMELSQPYVNALDQIKKGHQYDIQHRAVEHSLVHTVSARFFRALCEQFRNKVAELQTRIDKIDSMARPQQKHRAEKTDKQQLIQILQGQLDQINALLGTT